jgi:agmatine deiminase
MVSEHASIHASPRAGGYSMPAEWAPHRGCFTAWPAHAYAWGEHLGAARREFKEFVRAFTGHPQQEPLTVLVNPEQLAEARAELPDLPGRVILHELPYGDVWLRDIGPLFVKGPAGIGSVRFRFNGWGLKYVYPNDAEVAERIATERGGPSFSYDFVLEGGAVEVDGQGTCLTTRSCLQNPNRGAPAEQAVIDARLRNALGLSQVIWLDAGLANDHTDGHIDNIARFVAPGVVVCMQAHDANDPNRDTLEKIAKSLQSARDAAGRALRVVRVPSPGRVLGADGQVMPASYMNFYIGNARVIVPSFGSDWDEPGRVALQSLFPRHEVVSSSARALLEGGGTFHCMTQQEPAP